MAEEKLKKQNMQSITLTKGVDNGFRRFYITDGRGNKIELSDIELPKVMGLLRQAYDEIELERETKSIFSDVVLYYANAGILKDVFVDQFAEQEENLVRVRCYVQDPGFRQIVEKSFWRKFRFKDSLREVCKQTCYVDKRGRITYARFTRPDLADHGWLRQKDDNFYIFKGDPTEFTRWAQPEKGEITDFNDYIMQFKAAGLTVGDILDQYNSVTTTRLKGRSRKNPELDNADKRSDSTSNSESMLVGKTDN